MFVGRKGGILQKGDYREEERDVLVLVGAAKTQDFVGGHTVKVNVRLRSWPGGKVESMDVDTVRSEEDRSEGTHASLQSCVGGR